MKTPVLHYLYDPFCGWCYGAAPLLSAAQELPGLAIEAHGIGMLSDDRVRMMSPEWRAFVRPHEERISALSGQQFSAAYQDGIQSRTDVLLDSSIPTRAMMAAQASEGRGLDMLKALQLAYYQAGREISERSVIDEVVNDLRLNADAFHSAYELISEDDVRKHINDSDRLMTSVEATGVPTLFVDTGKEIHPMPIGHYLGRPERFSKRLKEILSINAH